VTRRHLRLLLCTATVVALGAGTWSLFTVRPGAAGAPDATRSGAARAGMVVTQEPVREALDAIGLERTPSAVARDTASSVLAATSMVGLVALLWCSTRRSRPGVRGRTVLAAAPRGPPRALRT
jgi:hypothetical protein